LLSHAAMVRGAYPAQRMRGSWGRTWLLLFAAFALLIATQLNLIAVIRFSVDNASTSGSIVGLTPQTHDRFQVEYEVDGTRLTMESNDEGGASAHQIGDKVTVFYSRAEPTYASLQPPGRVLTGATFFLVLFAGLAAALFASVIGQWRRARP
jgi:hypothetical protein